MAKFSAVAVKRKGPVGVSCVGVAGILHSGVVSEWSGGGVGVGVENKKSYCGFVLNKPEFRAMITLSVVAAAAESIIRAVHARRVTATVRARARTTGASKKMENLSTIRPRPRPRRPHHRPRPRPRHLHTVVVVVFYT